MSLHIYRTDAQPFTRWRLGPEIQEKPSKWFLTNPRSQHWCDSCYRTRWAENLEIRVYYDHSRVSCKGGCAPSTYKERYARLRKLRRRHTEPQDARR